MAHMELTLGLKKGKDSSSVWVNGYDVSRSRNEQTEQQAFVAKEKANDVAIAWATDLVAQGWTLDELSVYDGGPGDLTAVLKRLPAPAKLTLTGEPLRTIAELEALPDLVELKLIRIVRATDLAPLRALARLGALEVYTTDATLTLADLPALPALREVRLRNLNGIDGDGLKKYPGVERMSIESVSVASLAYLADAALPLRALSLSWLEAKGPLSLAPLEAMAPTLEALAIYLRDVAISDVEAIGRCKNLVSLALQGVPISLELLGTLSKLRSLDVAMPPSSLAPLASLASLESLVLSLPEKKKKLPKGAVSALVGNDQLQITVAGRTWSVANLDGYLAGTFKLPTLKDAARPARAIKTKTLKKGATTPAHFGGSAQLGEGEAWPRCKNCDQPMPLFVELDLAKVPIPNRALAGTLQFFYCNSTEPLCEVDCESWRLNDRAMLLRVIPSTKKTATVECPADVPSPVPARSIELRPEKADFPDRQDARDRYEIYEAPRRTQAGDKLLGWPDWVQGNEWPSCPDCGKPMDLLMQMASNKGIDHQWGDSGDAYLFLCFDHPARVGFVWQGC